MHFAKNFPRQGRLTVHIPVPIKDALVKGADFVDLGSYNLFPASV
jgi:hypothetical protein